MMDSETRAFAVILGPDAVPDLVLNSIRLIPGIDAVLAQTESGELIDPDCPEGHICANYQIHAQAKIIRQRMEIASLKEQVRIATDQLQAFSDQGKERYPGEMGTFAHDALIQMSVVE
jgi:hypothetical protein